MSEPQAPYRRRRVGARRRLWLIVLSLLAGWPQCRAAKLNYRTSSAMSTSRCWKGWGHRGMHATFDGEPFNDTWQIELKRLEAHR